MKGDLLVFTQTQSPSYPTYSYNPYYYNPYATYPSTYPSAMTYSPYATTTVAYRYKSGSISSWPGILTPVLTSTTAGVSSEPAEKSFRGFLIADLSNPDNPGVAATVPIEDTINPEGFLTAGKTLYYSYSSDVDNDSQEQPQSKYYLSRIDLSNPSHPLELSAVNIL